MRVATAGYNEETAEFEIEQTLLVIDDGYRMPPSEYECFWTPCAGFP